MNSIMGDYDFTDLDLVDCISHCLRYSMYRVTDCPLRISLQIIPLLNMSFVNNFFSDNAKFPKYLL